MPHSFGIIYNQGNYRIKISFKGNMNDNLGFTMNQSETHKTICGGLVTILITILSILYLFIVISEPVSTRSDGSVSSPTRNLGSSNTVGDSFSIGNGFYVQGQQDTKISIKQTNYDSTVYNMANFNFMIAVQMDPVMISGDVFPELYLNDQYGNIISVVGMDI